MNYQKLFNYFYEEHGITMLQTDMQEVIRIVNEMQEEDKNTELHHQCKTCGKHRNNSNGCSISCLWNGI